jgi:hypothetical protein
LAGKPKAKKIGKQSQFPWIELENKQVFNFLKSNSFTICGLELYSVKSLRKQCFALKFGVIEFSVLSGKNYIN